MFDSVFCLKLLCNSSFLVADLLLHQDRHIHRTEAGGEFGAGLTDISNLREEDGVGDEDEEQQHDTPFLGKENNQQTSNNPRDEAGEDVSRGLQLVIELESIEGGNDHGDDAPAEEEDGDEPPDVFRQAVPIGVTQVLLLLPRIGSETRPECPIVAKDKLLRVHALFLELLSHLKTLKSRCEHTRVREGLQ